MKRVPAFFILLLTGILSQNAFAQTDYDPKAKAILDDISKTAKGYTSVTAAFSMTIKGTDGKTTVKNGSIVSRNKQYKITLDKDAKNKEEYYNDGATTWVYSQSRNEVTIDCAEQKKNDNTISPDQIFTFYEKGFKYKFIREETQNGKTIQVIELVPEKADGKKYNKIQLNIDKEKKQIASIIIFSKDGSTTTYTVKTFTPNQAVTDSTFRFDSATHAGVKVIDLREDGACQ